jgi:putative redox protein
MKLPNVSRHSIVAIPTDGARITAMVREHQVPTDQPARGGGTDTAPTPLELLSASLASCIALYVNRYCVNEGLKSEGLAVEVKPFWRENPGRIGRFDVVIHIPETIPGDYHADLLEVAEKCPVHHTLASGPELGVTVKRLPDAEHIGAA